MGLFATLATGLLLAGAPAATPTAAPADRAAPIYWGGERISVDARGLSRPSRAMIERWEQFAARRGYRLDLDESQRILTVSDADRFAEFAHSEVTVERALEALEPFVGEQSGPLVLLRASSEDDATDARIASDALGFGDRVFVALETSTLAQRRLADARLAELVARAELDLFAPLLSEWMADGIASHVAIEATGRALVDGELSTLRQVRARVERERKRDRRVELDLLELGGRRPGRAARPMEADALCVVAYLMAEHEGAMPRIVGHLGTAQGSRGEAKSGQEARELRTAAGLAILSDLQDALRHGRSRAR